MGETKQILPILNILSSYRSWQLFLNVYIAWHLYILLIFFISIKTRGNNSTKNKLSQIRWSNVFKSGYKFVDDTPN